MSLHKARVYIILIFVGVFVFSCRPTRFVPENEYLLNKVHVKCDNKSIDIEQAESYIKQKPNKHILVFFRFHLAVYNLAHIGKERKWKTKMGNIVGEEPVISDQIKIKKSCSQIKTYLNNKGYYYSEVTDSLKIKRKKIEVTYILLTGKPYIINEVNYQIEDEKLKSIIIPDTNSSLLKNGVNFDSDIIQNERVRITEKLKINGYYYFNKEYVVFDADTSIGNYKVNMNVVIKNVEKQLDNGQLVKENHKQYYIDSVFYFTDFDPKLALQEREKYYKTLDTIEQNGYYFVSQNGVNIKPKVLIRACYLSSGVLYDSRDVDRTYRNLTSLKTFRLVNIQFAKSLKKNYLNSFIELTPLSIHSYKIEAEGTNSSGNLGLAGNVLYQNRNIFRGAQQWDVKVRGAIERQSSVILENNQQIQEYLPFNTIEIGGESKLYFSTFLMPFPSEEFIKRRNPKTSISISYNYQQRPDYTRTISNVSFGYVWQGNKNLKHFFNPVEINYVNLPYISWRFRNSINGTFLENSYTNHMVTVTSYGFLFNDANFGKHHDNVYIRGQIESAGNILSAYNDLKKSKTVDGSYQLLNTKYAQFIKAEADLRYFHKVTKGTKMAYRLFGGIGVPYGNMNVLPFEKRYYCGGASSIRAWAVRSLGPGSYKDTLAIPNQTADIKAEANIEYRFKLFWVIEGALFVDAGNIWDLKKTDGRSGAVFTGKNFYNDIAIGYGVGLRLDFSFFVFRVDVGIKGRDPSQPVGERWIQWHRKNLPSNYSFTAFNLGIGYPF